MMIVINPRSLWKLVGQAARQCQLRISGTVAERSSSTIARGIEQRRNEGQDLAGQEAHPAKLVSKHLACAAVDPCTPSGSRSSYGPARGEPTTHTPAPVPRADSCKAPATPRLNTHMTNGTDPHT